MRTTPIARLRFALFGATLLTAAAPLAGCGPKYPNCKEDKDCHEGEFCVNGLCQMCRSDADCPAGQSCTDGRCETVQGFCESNADCPSGQECENNRCVTPTQSRVDGPDSSGAGSCQLQPVYFAFDSDELDVNSRNALQANLACIRQRNLSTVHVTGHTDPRGTEEYNLALGDRRARAVKAYLQSLGVEEGKMSASSMGEEMSAGEDESGWTQDRRVEFSDR